MKGWPILVAVNTSMNEPAKEPANGQEALACWRAAV